MKYLCIDNKVVSAINLFLLYWLLFISSFSVSKSDKMTTIIKACSVLASVSKSVQREGR